MKYVINVVSALFIFALFNGAYAHTDTKVVVIPIGDGVSKIYGSCKEILDAGASTGDGVYMVDTEGDGITILAVYCDMATGTTYEALAFGQYNQSYTGYSLLTLAQWQSAPVQAAFLWYFNSNDGLNNLDEGFVDNNCCFILRDNKTLRFGGSLIYPQTPAGATLCNTAHAAGRQYFYLANFGTGAGQPPLAVDFFTQYPPTSTANCIPNNNPGFFVKSYQ